MITHRKTILVTFIQDSVGSPQNSGFHFLDYWIPKLWLSFSGLVLKLDIEQPLYIGSLSQGAGVRVTLHEQGTMPFPYEEGFNVNPGMSTYVGLRKVQ